MGRSAKITRGGNKKRVNVVRQEKKAAEYNAAKRAESSAVTGVKKKKRVRIEAANTAAANFTTANTIGAGIAGGVPVSSALARSDQMVENSVKRLQKQAKVGGATMSMVPREDGKAKKKVSFGSDLNAE